MDSWMLLKNEAQKFFLIKDYQKACDYYKDALTVIESKFDKSEPDLKVEAAKITSNLSLMYYKLSKEQNDESLLHESKTYAKKTISYNPKWIKGYLRIADVCKQNQEEDEILNVITLCLQHNKDAKYHDDFLSLVREVKYYTHKKIMMLSPSWHLVKFKDNVFSVDLAGAGHFKDFEEFANFLKKSEENNYISLLVRPFSYTRTVVFTKLVLDIVGDCQVEITPTTKAIDDDSLVAFMNRLPQFIDRTPNSQNTNLSTFSFQDCIVSLKRIAVFKRKAVYASENLHSVNAITCKNTDIKLLECFFFSKMGYGLDCFENSKLVCKRCFSKGCFNGVSIDKSQAKITDCHFSNMEGIGIIAKNEAEMIVVKHCTITNCKRQGLLVFNGAKMAKVIDSHFEDNCAGFGYGMGSIDLKGCSVIVKNTVVQNHSSVGIFIVGGSGNFDNVVIKNCLVGMIVVANTTIANCIIESCPNIGILTDKISKGNIVLENNKIINCLIEIARVDNTPMPTFIGESKHKITTMPAMDMIRENGYKEVRMARRMDSVEDIRNQKVCDYCAMRELHSQACSSKTLKLCGKCKMVFYCSLECQQKGWKLHKLNCEMFVKTKLNAKEELKAFNETNSYKIEIKSEEIDISNNNTDEKEKLVDVKCEKISQ